MAKRVKIETEPFIRAWQAANSAEEVSNQLGTKLASVTARANYYRKKGINLKKMPRKNGVRLDIEAAKALLAELHLQE